MPIILHAVKLMINTNENKNFHKKSTRPYVKWKCIRDESILGYDVRFEKESLSPELVHAHNKVLQSARIVNT